SEDILKCSSRQTRRDTVVHQISYTLYQGLPMAVAALPPLEKLDPAEAWKSWQPDAKNPWDLKWAGHLYRRATFGAGLRELRQAVTDGLPATLDRLLAGDPKAGERLKFLVTTGERI